MWYLAHIAFGSWIATGLLVLYNKRVYFFPIEHNMVLIAGFAPIVLALIATFARWFIIYMFVHYTTASIGITSILTLIVILFGMIQHILYNQFIQDSFDSARIESEELNGELDIQMEAFSDDEQEEATTETDEREEIDGAKEHEGAEEAEMAEVAEKAEIAEVTEEAEEAEVAEEAEEAEMAEMAEVTEEAKEAKEAKEAEEAEEAKEAEEARKESKTPEELDTISRLMLQVIGDYF